MPPWIDANLLYQNPYMPPWIDANLLYQNPYMPSWIDIFQVGTLLLLASLSVYLL